MFRDLLSWSLTQPDGRGAISFATAGGLAAFHVENRHIRTHALVRALLVRPLAARKILPECDVNARVQTMHQDEKMRLSIKKASVLK